jgi:hypothetical protein
MAIPAFSHRFMHHRALEFSPVMALKTDGFAAHIGPGQCLAPAFMADITLPIFKGRMG